MYRTIFAMTAAFGISMGGLVACGGGDESTPPTPPAPGAPAPDAPAPDAPAPDAPAPDAPKDPPKDK